MNTYGQGLTGPAGMPLTREMREGGEQQMFRAQEDFIPRAEPAPVQPATTGNYFTPDEARTRFAQHLPIQATPNDVLLPSDDPRVYTYQMPNGDLYYLPAFEEQLTERRGVGQVIESAVDNFPSRTEVESALLGAPQAAYNSIRNMVTGQGTYEDVLGTATGMVGANIIPRSRFTDELLSDTPADGPNDYWDDVESLRPGQEISDAEYFGYNEDAVDTDFEPIGDWPPPTEEELAAHREQGLANRLPDEEPEFNWQPEPEPQPPANPVVWNSITPEQGSWLVPPAPLREGKKPNTGTSPLYPPRDYTTDYTIPNTVVFRSPVRDIVAGLEVPSQGIKGSQFIKMLQDNPSVRNSEVSALDLGINPQARYTREELDQLVNSRVPQVEGYLTQNYASYQRQKVQDQEIGYDELVIEATPQEGVGFKARSQHYGSNTLAHTRISTREGPNGPYVLVEEMQSDLIQQGWDERKAFGGSFIDWMTNDYPTAVSLGGTDLQRITRILDERSSDIMSGELGLYEISDLIRDSGVEQIGILQPFDIAAMYRDYKLSSSAIQPPPIRNTQESTRLLVESLISYADQRGVNEIVFPPLERIAAERFSPGTEEYNKAITPGSGFHQTYVASLKKVLQEFQNEFGRENLPVYRRELNYEQQTVPSLSFQAASWDFDDIRNARDNDNLHNFLSETFEDDDGQIINRGDYYNRIYSYDFLNATTPNELLEMNAEINKSTMVSLPTDGIAINIGALREQYNLNYPRFAEGGLVTQTKQAFGGMM